MGCKQIKDIKCNQTNDYKIIKIKQSTYDEIVLLIDKLNIYSEQYKSNDNDFDYDITQTCFEMALIITKLYDNIKQCA